MVVVMMEVSQKKEVSRGQEDQKHDNPEPHPTIQPAEKSRLGFR
jgi:hypothetical protein